MGNDNKCKKCGNSNTRTFIKGDCVVLYCHACGGWSSTGGGSQAEVSRLIEESKAELRNEEAYSLALSHAKKAKENKSPEEYLKAKKEFDSLGDFKDSQEQAKACWDAAHKISVGKQKRVGFLILAAAALVAVLAFTYVVKVLRPSQIYQQAQALYEEGDYSGAMEKYNASGNYKDSTSRAVLCTALLDLQAGNPESVLESLVSLQEDGESKLASTLSTAIIEAVSS